MKKVIFILFFITLILIGGCNNKMSNTKVKIETNLGEMEFELFDELTPKTVENFKKLIEQDFYNGQRFHRVIKDFMIQMGDPLSKDISQKDRWGTGGPGYVIKDEFTNELRHNKKGLLSMANKGPNTGSSQFFITLIPTPWLDDKHAIFGQIIKGDSILEDIGKTQVDGADRPVKDVIIERIIII
jgi:peptidyl-prolyl cis-trans isomerase A (cyclophilin A)/peptidyl-prolyl cis-trans isomerase-like 1|tara:strand:- start:131 stop:685 length:555 start_codon:yes stop_codon:yes gene_type:complete